MWISRVTGYDVSYCGGRKGDGPGVLGYVGTLGRYVVGTHQPKSVGRLVSDMSLRPSTVSARSWLKPCGRRGMGLLLKSATCSARRCLMSSGMSGMSATNKQEEDYSLLIIGKTAETTHKTISSN